MRLLIATPLYPPDIGGPAKYAEALYTVFTELDKQVSVVVYGKLERHLPLGIRHIVYFFRLLPHVLHVDHVLAFDTWSTGLPALLAAKLCGKKLLVRIGGDFLWEAYVERTGNLLTLSDFYSQIPPLSLKEKFVWWGTRFFLNHTDALLFTTTWQRDIWYSAYKFSMLRAHVVENYYPPKELFTPAVNRVFVSAGRNIRLKNVSILQKAFALVKKEYEDIVLDTQTLPPKEHHARLRNCYGVIVSSVSEVNPNTIIESISIGKPFIAPRDSGIYDRLQGLGLFVDTTDIAVLQRAITQLLDPAVYAQYVAQIETFAFTHSWQDIAQEILQIAMHL